MMPLHHTTFKNIVTKGETAQNKLFFLSSECFQLFSVILTSFIEVYQMFLLRRFSKSSQNQYLNTINQKQTTLKYQIQNMEYLFKRYLSLSICHNDFKSRILQRHLYVGICWDRRVNPLPHIDAFWRLCSRLLLKTWKRAISSTRFNLSYFNLKGVSKIFQVCFQSCQLHSCCMWERVKTLK